MKRATALYRKFNGHPAARIHVQDIPLTETLVDLGACVAVAYRSNKEGRNRDYEHTFKNSRLYSTENGQVLIIVGDRLKVSDWIRGG